MKKLFLLIPAIATALLTGCATTPMESSAKNEEAKQFALPETGKSGLYIYRDDSIVGGALKKNIYVDDALIGESAPGVFFYKKVTAGAHKLSTESEFSENHLPITTESGKNYFFRQYIKMGAFVGGANLEQVSEEKGKEEVRKLKLAITH